MIAKPFAFQRLLDNAYRLVTEKGLGILGIATICLETIYNLVAVQTVPEISSSWLQIMTLLFVNFGFCTVDGKLYVVGKWLRKIYDGSILLFRN